MNASERSPYLEAGDKALVDFGYVRRKREFQWKRRAGGINVDWIHLNFGLALLIPSFGIHYLDLDDIVSKTDGGVSFTSRTLHTITKKTYSSENATPDALFAEIVDVALREIEKLRDRDLVIWSLQQEGPEQWPVYGGSFRIRLLPALLASRSKISEALDWVRRFEVSSEYDQIIPKYNVFATKFRAKYSA